MTAADRPTVTAPGGAVAVVYARDGSPPVGADEAVAEAGGAAVVVGDGAADAAKQLRTARQVWWRETGSGLRVRAVAASLADAVRDVPLVVFPASPDGRDLAPRLAAWLDRPLLANAVQVDYDAATHTVRAQLSRLDDRWQVPAAVAGAAVATLVPGVRAVEETGDAPAPVPLDTAAPADDGDVEVVRVVDPDPATMDLGDATRVLAAGAGLTAAGSSDEAARAAYRLLAEVAAALGASAGATRVVTDAGWMDYARQIGTTGVTVHPDLYVALGISGASQHVGGIVEPQRVVSVNTDPSCPMTAMADLGLVTDARAFLVELARRLGVAVPAEVEHG
ncbi:MAG: electron transfer flavoprotein subunit alpha/FixB family protein [Streptosporangiales bacterium]|nr:electron transfer flavoprotein subunit alpha/FixB family protein [Streptosporangiales bacterium]